MKLVSIHPKLPMSNKIATRTFYVQKLGFIDIGSEDYDGYLILKRDTVEIHFFEFKDLFPDENYGQVYIRTEEISIIYQSFIENEVAIHVGGKLSVKPWGQIEFSILDPDNNLLTFGQAI